jgi:predicted DNA-binding protein
MKTAISVPDETFERASQRASELGISRSAFFSRAAERYLQELDRESLRSRVEEAVKLIGNGGVDEDSAALMAAGRRRLAENDDDW